MPSHGDKSNVKLDPADNLEVISLGLSRTGTTSLQFALDKLDFGPCHGGVDVFRSPERRDGFAYVFEEINKGHWDADSPELSRRIRELMRGFRSTTDVPLPYLVQETVAT